MEVPREEPGPEDLASAEAEGAGILFRLPAPRCLPVDLEATRGVIEHG